MDFPDTPVTEITAEEFEAIKTEELCKVGRTLMIHSYFVLFIHSAIDSGVSSSGALH
jgi:hypothetical protein